MVEKISAHLHLKICKSVAVSWFLSIFAAEAHGKHVSISCKVRVIQETVFPGSVES
jgi:hypothetical protein